MRRALPTRNRVVIRRRFIHHRKWSAAVLCIVLGLDGDFQSDELDRLAGIPTSHDIEYGKLGLLTEVDAAAWRSQRPRLQHHRDAWWRCGGDSEPLGSWRHTRRVHDRAWTMTRQPSVRPGKRLVSPQLGDLRLARLEEASSSRAARTSSSSSTTVPAPSNGSWGIRRSTGIRSLRCGGKRSRWPRAGFILHRPAWLCRSLRTGCSCCSMTAKAASMNRRGEPARRSTAASIVAVFRATR